MLKFAENKKERKRLGKDVQPSPIVNPLQPFGTIMDHRRLEARKMGTLIGLRADYSFMKRNPLLKKKDFDLGDEINGKRFVRSVENKTN